MTIWGVKSLETSRHPRGHARWTRRWPQFRWSAFGWWGGVYVIPQRRKSQRWWFLVVYFTNIYHTNQLIIPGSPKLRMVFMELKYHACCQRWFLDTPCNHSSSDRTGEPGCLGLGVGNSNTLGKMIQFDYCARFFQKGLEPGDISPIFPENFGKSSTQSRTFW